MLSGLPRVVSSEPPGTLEVYGHAKHLRTLTVKLHPQSSAPLYAVALLPPHRRECRGDVLEV